MATETSILEKNLKLSLQQLAKGGDTEKMDHVLNELMALASSQGTVGLHVQDDRTVQVRCRDENDCSIAVARAHGIVRTLCARLAVQCSEWCGNPVSPYGGEVEFKRPNGNHAYRVFFENTPGNHHIEIERMDQTQSA